MNKQVKPQTKHVHKDMNIGVVIIFLIITLVFILSLTKSNYSKELFSQKIELRE